MPVTNQLKESTNLNSSPQKSSSPKGKCPFSASKEGFSGDKKPANNESIRELEKRMIKLRVMEEMEN